ncbi:MAG: tyrosine-type recombinase/integrase [Anaerolineae bacterium]|nr:tyrosine-type recombinase/integrase [Anaerolineae bacterium]
MSTDIDWHKFPRVARQEIPKAWLSFGVHRGLAHNTIQAYGRALEDYLAFCEREEIVVTTATREHVARYLHDLRHRPLPANVVSRTKRKRVGLSAATLKQRLTAIRLFYDHLIHDGYRDTNPVGRGHYVAGQPAAGQRGLVPSFHSLPWIPNDEEWLQILTAAREEGIRNRFMFALAYDAGLRREELCLVATYDLDPSRRLLTVRAENTKNRRARTVPFSEATGVLLQAYLEQRRQITRERGLLFVSQSPRNYGQPISKWTWSKVVRGIACRAGVSQFSTHTLRHLCLTDLARSNWDIHQIALFAGHSSIQTTLLYIHLSGRELAEKLQSGMNQIHSWRMQTIEEAVV